MKNALIVDDTKNIRSLLTTCLELEGYTVCSAGNAKEGLQYFESERFDIAFIDIKMPEMSGTELFKTIRKKNIMTPVIIMTAFATVKNAIECTKLGAVAYLQKPFTPDRVKNVLNETLTNTQQSSLCPTHSDTQNDDLLSICTNLIEHNNNKGAFSLLTTSFSKNPANYKIYIALSKIYSSQEDENKAILFSQIADMLKNLKAN